MRDRASCTSAESVGEIPTVREREPQDRAADGASCVAVALSADPSPALGHRDEERGRRDRDDAELNAVGTPAEQQWHRDEYDVEQGL